MTGKAIFVPRENLSVAELSYAAGLFDGEGTIGFWEKKEPFGMVLRAQVANSSDAMVEWLRDRFGGSIHENCGGRYVNLRINAWQVSARLADAFLRKIRPYVIAKAAEVDVALRYYGEGNTERQGYRRVSDAERTRRQNLRLELRQIRLDRRLPRGDKITKPLVTWHNSL